MSGDGYCDVLTSSECQPCDELASDQEEADTKVVLHAKEVLSSQAREKCVSIRSPSGDTDILVIALGTIVERSRVLFDYGNGTNRSKIWLDQVMMPTDLRQALIGFHAFSGNDYVSSFFRKGKGTCWDALKDDDVAVEALTQLGEAWELTDGIKNVLEGFVCKLYGSKSSINDARFQLFERKQKKGVIVDLSLLPPCKSALELHLERANYVARIWKLAGTAMIQAPHLAGRGWDVVGDIEWIDEMFPEDITTLFLSLQTDSDTDNEEESDDEESDVGDDDDSDGDNLYE